MALRAERFALGAAEVLGRDDARLSRQLCHLVFYRPPAPPAVQVAHHPKGATGMSDAPARAVATKVVNEFTLGVDEEAVGIDGDAGADTARGAHFHQPTPAPPFALDPHATKGSRSVFDVPRKLTERARWH